MNQSLLTSLALQYEKVGGECGWGKGAMAKFVAVKVVVDAEKES